MYMSLVSFILFFLLLFFYYITSKSDPGEIPKKSGNSLLLLAEQGDNLKNICPWCVNIINVNTYHCFLCNKCFEYQEFHDVYLNNCVGRKNYGLYLDFLYYLIIDFSFKLALCFFGIFLIKGEKYSKMIKLIIPQAIMVSGFIIFGIFKIKTNNRSKKFFLISDNNLNKLSINSNNDDNSYQQKINIEMPYIETK